MFHNQRKCNFDGQIVFVINRINITTIQQVGIVQRGYFTKGKSNNLLQQQNNTNYNVTVLNYFAEQQNDVE